MDSYGLNIHIMTVPYASCAEMGQWRRLRRLRLWYPSFNDIGRD
jgi:hypothetical protein